MIEKVVESGLCTGCCACLCACPVDAISLTENKYAEIVPTIARELCIGCGKCARSCPQERTVKRFEPFRCYAAWAAEPAAREGSSSGGVGYLLAFETVEKGGAACGCVMGREVNPRHVVVREAKDVEALRGSKYVQSETGMVFREVKDLLDGGVSVTFFGTPCQVAGLRSFLGDSPDGLLCVDLVCHGVPPMAYLRQHVAAHADLGVVEEVSFRDGTDYHLRVRGAEGIELYEKGLPQDAYLSAFMEGVSHRENCYSCPYAGLVRAGDLTIGDFWGLDRSKLSHEPPRAVSVILVNTEKGETALSTLGDALVLEVRGVEEAAEGNDQLRAPLAKGKFRDSFRDTVSKKGFTEACHSCGMTWHCKLVQFKASKAAAPLRALKRLIKTVLGR